MKAMVISLILILLTPLSLSLDFKMDYPENVVKGEEFTVTISSDSTEEVYDIKIFIHDDSQSSSEIYDTETDYWKSSHFYLKSVYPDQDEFMVRAHYEGDTEICSRIRKTGGSSFDEECDDIEVFFTSDNESYMEEDDEESNNKTDEDKENVITTQTENNPIPDEEYNDNPAQVENINQVIDYSKYEGKILLSNTQLNNTGEQDPYITKDGKSRIYIIYSFTALVIFIVIFLVFRKL